jgi:hypothetical protein
MVNNSEMVPLSSLLPAMVTPAPRWWPQVDLAPQTKGDQGHYPVPKVGAWTEKKEGLTYMVRVLLLLVPAARWRRGSVHPQWGGQGRRDQA